MNDLNRNRVCSGNYSHLWHPITTSYVVPFSILNNYLLPKFLAKYVNTITIFLKEFCYEINPCEEKYIFSNFFLWTSELPKPQALYKQQVHPIPTPFEPMANFCWKHVSNSCSLSSLVSLNMQPCGENYPKVEG
jgi:hypothetical protein